MSGRLMRRWDRLPDGSTVHGIVRCDCSAHLQVWTPGADVVCDRCDRAYNSSGQLLHSQAPLFGPHGGAFDEWD